MSRLRNRMTKATFWTDGELLRWPRDKRFFYKSLWSMAEDSCCIEDDPFEWKLTAWSSPLDADITLELIEQWRDELIASGKAIRYTDGTKAYLYLPHMAAHEKPRNPQSPDLPLPEWVTCSMSGEGKGKRVEFTHSTSGFSVQNSCGNREGSPALPCPDLSCPVQSSAEYRAPQPRDSFPKCMTTDSWASDDGVFKTSQQHVLEAIEQKHQQIVSPSDAGLIGAAIKSRCPDGCRADQPERCAFLAISRINKASRLQTAAKWIGED